MEHATAVWKPPLLGQISWTNFALATKSPFFMRPLLVLFCVLALLRAASDATPAEEFTGRGKALLANNEKLSDPKRLHRLFDLSWEYTMEEAPEFASAGGYPEQNEHGY